jgi:hypothetical protein
MTTIKQRLDRLEMASTPQAGELPSSEGMDWGDFVELFAPDDDDSNAGMIGN